LDLDDGEDFFLGHVISSLEGFFSVSVSERR